jgi:hypothetical protein
LEYSKICKDNVAEELAGAIALAATLSSMIETQTLQTCTRRRAASHLQHKKYRYQEPIQ